MIFIQYKQIEDYTELIFSSPSFDLVCVRTQPKKGANRLFCHFLFHVESNIKH